MDKNSGSPDQSYHVTNEPLVQNFYRIDIRCDYDDAGSNISHC
jgi:hypothetical protein